MPSSWHYVSVGISKLMEGPVMHVGSEDCVILPSSGATVHSSGKVLKSAKCIAVCCIIAWDNRCGTVEHTSNGHVAIGNAYLGSTAGKKASWQRQRDALGNVLLGNLRSILKLLANILVPGTSAHLQGSKL